MKYVLLEEKLRQKVNDLYNQTRADHIHSVPVCCNLMDFKNESEWSHFDIHVISIVSLLQNCVFVLLIKVAMYNDRNSDYHCKCQNYDIVHNGLDTHAVVDCRKVVVKTAEVK